MSPEIIEVKYALDTFYFLVCGALVMWMAAGFTMLEAGLVRSKNTTEILTKNVALFAISCTMYLLMGYVIMYGGSEGGFLPDAWFGNGISNATAEEVLASNGDTYYSGASDFFFQVVFVATAMSIVSGAVAERMKLWAFLAFAVVMTGFIYPMQGMWKWGGGFLDAAGFQDFAGSGVVHMCGAAAALAGVILLGARKGKYTADGRVNAIPGANMPLAAIGMFILWMGWFGFNGGSVLSGDPEGVSLVFVTTSLAASAGAIGAFFASYFMFKSFDLSMVLNGILGGLVGITAGADVISPAMSIVVGAIAGVIIPFSVVFFDKIKIDDPVGATSVHLVCGIWGTLAVGIFGGANFFTQLIGTLSVIGFTFAFSIAVGYAIKATMGLRVSEEEEMKGLDIGEHDMMAYADSVEGGSYNLAVK